MSAAEFVAAARGFVGVRWRHRGRKPWAIDCVGLIFLSGEKSGCPNCHDETDYGREPWDDRLRKGCIDRWGEPLPVDQAQPGDIALIRWGKGEPSHLGIVGDKKNGLTLIHAHSVRGVCELSIVPPYDKQIVDIFRPWK